MGNKNKSRRLKSLPFSLVEPVERRLLMSTYTVNTLSDAINPGAGLLTLRQAIADANAHAGNDTIAFSPTVFTSGSLHTISLTQGEIDFTDYTGTTTVIGPGAGTVAVDAHMASRVLGIEADANVSISGMTITGGVASLSDAGGNTSGGGIFSVGTLNLSNCDVTDNAVHADTYTYINEQLQAYFPGVARGGAIYSTGSLIITGSTISDNTAVNQAGGVNYFGGDGGAADGGAIYSTGSLDLEHDTLFNNLAQGSGLQGPLPSSNSPDGGPGSGGAVYTTAAATINASVISDNAADGGDAEDTQYGASGNASGGGVWAGGDLTVTASTITGNNAGGGNQGYDFDTFYGGSSSGGGLDVMGTLTLTNSTVSQNNADSPVASSGGGVAAATAVITADTIDINSAVSYGGGIAGGQFTIKNTTISGNSVDGPINQANSYEEGGKAAQGGGLFANGASTITSSTINGNFVDGGSAADVNPYGTYSGGGTGGPAQGGGVASFASLTITNSTVALNRAIGGNGGNANQVEPGANGGNAVGGGIFDEGALTVLDTTVVGNNALGGGGGAASFGDNPNPAGSNGQGEGSGIGVVSTAVLLDNSIVATNPTTNIFGTINSSSANNFLGDAGGITNGVNGNIVGNNNPGLSPLGNNGGPTQTMVALPGSPVINKGKISLIPAGVTTDQRGFPRIQGSSVDIGATEFGTSVITGLVFNDWYASGKRDHAVDEALAGWTVYLDLNHNGQLDPGDISAVTNSSGIYTFNGIPAGAYSINIVGQRNFRLSSAIPLSVIAKANATVTAPAIAETGDALLLGTVVDSVTKKGLAGWRIYIDLNNSGKYVTTDPSVVTASDGSWSLSTPLIGTYTVRIVPENGYSLATPAAGDFVFTIGKGSIRSNNVFSEMKI